MSLLELCGNFKKRLRGNSIFSYNGTTKVCALCGKISFMFGHSLGSGTKHISLSQHIDCGLCDFINLNLRTWWALHKREIKCFLCQEVLAGQPHTYTRLLAHVLQCEKTEHKRNFSCCWPGCNKKKYLAKVPKHMLKHITKFAEAPGVPLKCIKKKYLVEKKLASVAAGTVLTCKATFETFIEFLNHVITRHNLLWCRENLRTMRDYFELGTTAEQNAAFCNRVALFLLYKTNYKKSLKKKV